MIVCGIDIGSNTVRALIANVIDGQIIDTLYSGRSVTRIGAGVITCGMLSERGIADTLQFLALAKTRVCEHGAQRVFAVATSAVRESSNRATLLDGAKGLGIDIQVISGEEEAQYIYKGASMSGAFNDVVVFDIGGGSTEFIFVKDGKIADIISVPIGVVKVLEQPDIDISASLAQMADIYNRIGYNDSVKLIGTAGAVTTVAAVDLNMPTAQYRDKAVDKHQLRLDRLIEMQEELASMTAAERLQTGLIEAGREDLIIPGIAILRSILKLLDKDVVTVSAYGLREGITIAASEK